MKIIFAVMDAYRNLARRHPVIFIIVNIVLVVLWCRVIMYFSCEDADESGSRSATVLVSIVNAVAPSADVTLENYESIGYLQNAERVIRKLAHITEYGILAFFAWSVLFGIKDLSRKITNIVPAVLVMILGIIDERNQTTVSGRYGTWIDVLVDMAGAVAVIWVIHRLTKRYRRMKNTHPSA